MGGVCERVEGCDYWIVEFCFRECKIDSDFLSPPERSWFDEQYSVDMLYKRQLQRLEGLLHDSPGRPSHVQDHRETKTLETLATQRTKTSLMLWGY